MNGRARLQIAQWADPEHGRYVKMTTRAGVLEGLVAVGMPRTSAELVQLFERGAELPADRSLLLRLDGPDQAASAGCRGPVADGLPVRRRQRDGHCRRRLRGLRDGGRGIRGHPRRHGLRRLPRRHQGNHRGPLSGGGCLTGGVA